MRGLGLWESREMAVGQGFEPWDGRPSLVFKTSAFDHSATPPVTLILIKRIVDTQCSRMSKDRL